MAAGLASGESIRSDLNRILILAAIDNRNVRLPTEDPQLFHRGRTVHVSRGQYRMALALGFEPSRELRNRSRFARTLQANDHDFDRRPDLQIDLARGSTHRVLQLGRHESDQMLFGCERAEHVLAECLAPHVLDEIANDLDIDVSFEQGETDFAERILDIALGDSALALELFEDAFEAIAERIKHKVSGWLCQVEKVRLRSGRFK